MGKNIVEKIMAKAAGRPEVSVGDYLIGLHFKAPVYVHFNPRLLAEVKKFGGLFDPKVLKLVGAGHAGAGGRRDFLTEGETRRKAIDLAKELGVPDENIITMGQGGVEHVISGEKCWPMPGTISFSGVNGHSTTNGALGALIFCLSSAQVSYLVTGSIWAQVPETARLELHGSLAPGVTVRDICEYAIRELGPVGTPGQVMEWTGPVVDALGMDARFTLCSLANSTGAWSAIINPDRTTLAYVTSRTKEPFEAQVSDPDASYAKTVSWDVSGLEPQVVPPAQRTSAAPVSKFQGTRVDRCFIGACTNGRMEDMRLVARILKGRKVRAGVELNITPASAEIYRTCAREGILEIFSAADAYIPAPCCGMCNGYNTPLGAGEICISTGTNNLPGRIGSPKAEVYLASAATVAASAVAGEINDPRSFL